MVFGVLAGEVSAPEPPLLLHAASKAMATTGRDRLRKKRIRRFCHRRVAHARRRRTTTVTPSTVLLVREHARASLRRPLRTCSHRPQGGPQPLLPGAPLQRHGAPAPLLVGGDAGGEGRRWLGSGVHGRGGDPPHLCARRSGGRPAVGRRRCTGARPDDGARARARRARRHRAGAQRPQRAEPVLAGAGDRAVGAAGHLWHAVGGPRDEQCRHRRSPRVASSGGAPLARGRLRPGVRVRRARAHRAAAVPVAQVQRAYRRVRRIVGEPRAPAA